MANDVELEEAAFTKAICDAPSERTHRLVFADWLDDHGQHHRADYLRRIRHHKFVRRFAIMGAWALFPTMQMPPKIKDSDRYWMEPPPTQSARCAAWRIRILRGWEIPAHWQKWRYDVQAQYFGVYAWEMLHVLYPLLGYS